MITTVEIDSGMLAALDKQLKQYRLERAELRDKLADSEDAYTLLVQAIRREFDDIMTFAGEYGLQDDSPLVVTCGALRRIYATDEVFDDTTVQDAIAEAAAMRVRGRKEG